MRDPDPRKVDSIPEANTSGRPRASTCTLHTCVCVYTHSHTCTCKNKKQDQGPVPLHLLPVTHLVLTQTCLQRTCQQDALACQGNDWAASAKTQRSSKALRKTQETHLQGSLAGQVQPPTPTGGNQGGRRRCHLRNTFPPGNGCAHCPLGEEERAQLASLSRGRRPRLSLISGRPQASLGGGRDVQAQFQLRVGSGPWKVDTI